MVARLHRLLLQAGGCQVSPTNTNKAPPTLGCAESLSSNLTEGKKDSVRSTETETDLHACADVADGGTGETENGAAAAGEIDLRENPGASTDGPTAPVFEEWYHGKIGRKEVMWTRFKKACEWKWTFGLDFERVEYF